MAIESIWKETEQLWLERAVNTDRIKGPDREVEDLQRDIAYINDASEGSIYREHWPRPRTRP